MNLGTALLTTARDQPLDHLDTFANSLDAALVRQALEARVSRHWEDGVLDGLQVSRIQDKSGPDAFQADLGCLELSVFPGYS